MTKSDSMYISQILDLEFLTSAIQVLAVLLGLVYPILMDQTVLQRSLFQLLVSPPTSSKDPYGLRTLDTKGNYQTLCCRRLIPGYGIDKLIIQITSSLPHMVQSADDVRYQSTNFGSQSRSHIQPSRPIQPVPWHHQSRLILSRIKEQKKKKKKVTISAVRGEKLEPKKKRAKKMVVQCRSWSISECRIYFTAY